jgi:hypothetical protein
MSPTGLPKPEEGLHMAFSSDAVWAQAISIRRMPPAERAGNAAERASIGEWDES